MKGVFAQYLDESGFRSSLQRFSKHKKINMLQILNKKSSPISPRYRAYIDYKPCVLYDAGGDLSAEWYFQFWVFNPETLNFKRFKERFQINRIKKEIYENYPEKQAKKILNEKIDEIIKETNKWLEKFSPFEHYIIDIKRNIFNSIKEVIENNYNDSPERTRNSYNSVGNLFLKWLKENKYDGIFLEDFDRIKFLEFRNFLLAEKQLSNTTINNYIIYLQTFVTVMVENGWISRNYVKDIKPLKKIDSDAHEPLTWEELQTVKQHLEINHPDLWFFSMFIYYGYLRPKEICLLKYKHFDFERNLINVPGNISKTQKQGFIALLPQLKNECLKRGIEKLGDKYIFGTKLKPGATKIAPTRASEAWMLAVKKELGIKKDLYALKHTGAKYFILSGGKKEALQAQMRHSSITTTEIYLAKICPSETLMLFQEQFRTNI